MESPKRATVYFSAEVHRALRLRAAAADRSISDMVNDGVGLALAEDATDLESFTERPVYDAPAGNLRGWLQVAVRASRALGR